MRVKGSVKDRIRAYFFILFKKKKRIVDEEVKSKKPKKLPITFVNQNVIIKKNTIITHKKSETTNIKFIKNSIKKTSKQDNLIVSDINPHTSKKMQVVKRNIPVKLSKEKIEINKTLDKFIIKNNKLIEDLIIRLKSLEKKLKKAKTKEEIKKNNDELIKINEEIEKLKNLYETLLQKRNFKDYDILCNTLLLEYIENFKFQNSEENVNELVNKCKEKLKLLTSLSKLTYQINENKKINTNKKDKINYLDNDCRNRTVDFDKLKQAGFIISNYLKNENEFANNLLKEIKKTDIESKTISHFKFDKDYLNNIISLGITLNPFQKTLVGAFIYGFIINTSISKLLRKSFTREYETKYFVKYTEFVSKIKDNKSLIETTNYLLLNTMDNLDNLESYLMNEYKEYIYEPKYKELYDKVKNYKKILRDKQLELTKTKQNINYLEEKNKEKVKKIEEMYDKN